MKGEWRVRTFILVGYCIALVASVLIAALLIKEKKGLKNPVMIICLLTVLLMLWKIADFIGVFG